MSYFQKFIQLPCSFNAIPNVSAIAIHNISKFTKIIQKLEKGSKVRQWEIASQKALAECNFQWIHLIFANGGTLQSKQCDAFGIRTVTEIQGRKKSIVATPMLRLIHCPVINTGFFSHAFSIEAKNMMKFHHCAVQTLKTNKTNIANHTLATKNLHQLCTSHILQLSPDRTISVPKYAMESEWTNHRQKL